MISETIIQDGGLPKEFNKYKIKPSNEPMEEFCLPKKFTYQPQQSLLGDLLPSKHSPWTNENIRGTLVFHQIGAGKTCTSIAVCENYMTKKPKPNIVIVLPAALIGNFITELMSECAGTKYITKTERTKLKKTKPDEQEYKDIMKHVLKRIEKKYTIYSYHKFVNLINENKIKKLNNTLLVIDEIQNMISMSGTFYKSLTKVIDNSDDTLKLLIMSATPMFDKPVEIALTLNLLIVDKKEQFDINKFNQTFIKKTGSSYRAINMKLFKNKIQNLISYYRGAPPNAYPKVEFKTVKCSMSDFQYKSYLTTLSSEDNYIRGSFKNVDILNMPQNFFLGPRMISNVSFPNKSIGEDGFKSFNDEALKMSNVGEYSTKFLKILTKIKKSDGTVFVYSNFKELGGLKAFTRFIEAHGFKDYKTWGVGEKRFAIWSGDEPSNYKDEIKWIFNSKSNVDGSSIKIMFGSPSVKEGVSFLRVEQVHIMEPYWNMSRLLQIMGRAVRFCSHKDVPKSKRLVKIYLYLATYTAKDKSVKTIDQYIWSLAKKKNKLITQFEHTLKECAFDCELLYARNSYKDDEIALKCN